MNWLECICLLIFVGQLQCQYPPFLQDRVHSLPHADDVSLPIYLSSPLPFDDQLYSAIYVSSNGVISFGEPFMEYIAEPFPICVPVVTAFWDDIDLRLGGMVQYTVLDTHSSNRSIVSHVEEYLNRQHVKINVTMVLIAKWSEVCEYGSLNCSLTNNSFQVVIATDDNRSYAIFTYKCGSLQWDSCISTIGFSANSSYANTDCELGTGVTEIDCYNSGWTNVIYCISGGCRNYQINTTSEHHLPFIDLQYLPSLSMVGHDNGIPQVISFPSLPFGSSHYNKAYVNSNGVLSLGVPFNDTTPQLFPINASVITAYWIAPVTNQIFIEYGVIENGYIIDNVREYLMSQNIELNVEMVLMAVWTDLTTVPYCPLAHSNVHQVTIATDGSRSFAIFSYNCGLLRNDSCCNISIGFSAGMDFYANHKYSFSSNAANISCLSGDWTHIVYYIGGESCQISCSAAEECIGVDQCRCDSGWTVPECIIGGSVASSTVAITSSLSSTVVPSTTINSSVVASETVQPASGGTDSNTLTTTTMIVIIICISLFLIVVTMIVVVVLMLKRRKGLISISRRVSIEMEKPRYNSLRHKAKDEPATSGDHTTMPIQLVQLIPNAKVIPKERLKLLEMIGKGEFGIVYRGILNPNDFPQPVAAKTIKDCHSSSDINDLVEECDKMTQFNHPNVLSLIGVCLDFGPAPYIIMPFMAKGPLLAYLVKERHNLTLSDSLDMELIETTRKELLSMCLQVAKGMEYLVQQSFLHRDLAARNCLIDTNDIIKISDFGLSEDIYVRRYHREDDSSQKLPVKWMAIESLHKGLFSEKTDVWSFGVVCWEIFTSGNIPYPGNTPQDVINLLGKGDRLPPPGNAASSEEIYQMMRSCWRERDEERPTFTTLVFTIEALMAPLAEYLPMNEI